MTPAPPGNRPRGATPDGGTANTQRQAGSGRSSLARIVVTICALTAIIGFVVLGTWQIRRLAWKLDLIDRTGQRVHAAPVDAPAPDSWSTLTAKKDDYLHVRLTGIFLPERSVRVQAVTDLGPGFWLLTPLRQHDGAIVLINRGFVLARQSGPVSAQTVCSDTAIDPVARSEVTGLLRMSEPGGAFLHDNDPLAQRWYSRDVRAIAQQQQLGPVAPYFVDTDADPGQRNQVPSSDCPLGGLTVVSFQNNHLVYAVTWYALALMVAGAFGWNAFVTRRGTNTA